MSTITASKRHAFVCVLCLKSIENINFVHPSVVCATCSTKERARITSSNKRKIIKKLGLKKISYRDWIVSLRNHNYSCATCSVTNRKNLTLDHILPLSKGGNNEAANIQPLCYDCHMHKDGWAPNNKKFKKIKAVVEFVIKLSNKAIVFLTKRR